MTHDEFEKIAAESIKIVPKKFRDKLKNVAVLVEDDISDEIRREQGLRENETLLGLYRGIPQTDRGDYYGVGPTLPDTISLFMKPILAEAAEEGISIERAVAETLWHEMAHHFGLDEVSVRAREVKRIN